MAQEKTKTPDIYQNLRTKLITGYFSPGEKLHPELLRKDYGCSSNTIREVLLRLSSAGLASFEEQRGFRVRPATRKRQNDLAKFRIMLEQEGAALSIQHGGIEWEAQLSAAHHKLSHIESRIGEVGGIEPVLVLWCEAEWEFHETLIRACQSPLLHETYASVYDQFRQQLVTRERNYGYFELNITEHQRILEAALAREVPLCRQRIHEHLSRNLTEE